MLNMSKPTDDAEALSGTEGLTRRLVLAGLAGTGVLSLLMAGLPAAGANAATSWYHPFTTRGGVPHGGHFLSTYLNNGAPRRRPHQGIDFNPPGSGTPIYSCASGEVSNVHYTDELGYFVTVFHAEGFVSTYAHMTAGSITVRIGDQILACHQLGTIGATGAVTGAHLHLALSHNGALADPTFLRDAPLATPGLTAPPPPKPVENWIPRRNNNMTSFYYAQQPDGQYVYALAGDGRGAAAWLETYDPNFANQLAKQHGNAAQLTWGSYNTWKNRYLSADPVPGS